MQRSNVLLKTKAVLVTGARTPFVKSFGQLMKADTLHLATAAVGGLLSKAKIDPKEIDQIIWGNVVLQTNIPNCAREIVIDLNLPKNVTANVTSMACASGLHAMSQAIMLIESGRADVVIAGGSDSTSNAEIPLPKNITHALMKAQKGGVAGFFSEAGYNPMKWLPTGFSIAERSTGKTMGWHGDVIAELNNISRGDQEALALASHKKAAEAEKKGYFKDEVVPVLLEKRGKQVEIIKDDLIQRDTEKVKEKMPKLKPSFRKEKGTITAATSSPLTDGASAMLIMSEEKAKSLGYATDVTIKSFHFSGIDPFPQLLLAPVLGWGPCLKEAGITAKDIDLFEIHEAFAAQVLATIKCLGSPEFFEKYAGTSEVVLKGDFDFSKLNVNGSSIALGHPFAATGGRIVTSLANELRRTGKKHGLVSICAAGGLGGVAILEHSPKK
ncbi:acetyl-CoA acyltransferase [Angomonas deanei]|uniref:Thiolase, N-terminal domain/FAE1/Type III polyketide synthase-like protein/Beta-ketoacyl synthase, N-terminal domain/Thiolase, C-terminal domain containing protein, putative n=1 Tax=Angomonas deanei TaxID=59799 RepID=S9VPD2_9TRYP|nr:thiolase protein-like protein [Angomonas deanei]EPY43390.1 acetyl-CoA acyltransferase [Angomonas deanei]CAD2213822.1 Thiolase, N-terminal domain/FAE1/Type III polyketide synthase-like protein/Beta-ketoacyl synthase, N-terminal domain/Thiolase, C-terminal domain containing protein, putative [Angomonas deanei]|eukprot:EPY42699.1 thiolase protein-like protein [Angomonas deanei]